MRRQRFGRIVNLSSMGGRMALPGGGIYHATKYGVEALSDSLRFEVRGFGIDVVVIEPGAIKTEFGNTAARRVEALGSAGSPYAAFRKSLLELLRSANEGPLARLAGEADDVARAIERAITARRPRTRIPVTLGARAFMGSRRWLPDRAWDAAMRALFARPGG
jgi:short-subunit dehydrogenase